MFRPRHPPPAASSGSRQHQLTTAKSSAPTTAAVQQDPQQNPKEYLLSRLLAGAANTTPQLRTTTASIDKMAPSAKQLRNRRDSDLISDSGTYVVDGDSKVPTEDEQRDIAEARAMVDRALGLDLER
jgi:hypothetical protein